MSRSGVMDGALPFTEVTGRSKNRVSHESHETLRVLLFPPLSRADTGFCVTSHTVSPRRGRITTALSYEAVSEVLQQLSRHAGRLQRPSGYPSCREGALKSTQPPSGFRLPPFVVRRPAHWLNAMSSRVQFRMSAHSPPLNVSLHSNCVRIFAPKLFWESTYDETLNELGPVFVTL